MSRDSNKLWLCYLLTPYSCVLIPLLENDLISFDMQMQSIETMATYRVDRRGCTSFCFEHGL